MQQKVCLQDLPQELRLLNVSRQQPAEIVFAKTSGTTLLRNDNRAISGLLSWVFRLQTRLAGEEYSGPWQLFPKALVLS